MLQILGCEGMGNDPTSPFRLTNRQYFHENEQPKQKTPSGVSGSKGETRLFIEDISDAGHVKFYIPYPPKHETHRLELTANANSKLQRRSKKQR